MWKWLVGVSVLGLLELLLVVHLHQKFDLMVLVLIYIFTTIMGFVFLRFNRNRIFSDELVGKKRRKTLKLKMDTKQALTTSEMKSLQHMLGVMFYSLAFFLIIIPGLITDFVGIVIVVPNLLDWLINKSIQDYNDQVISNSK